MNPQTPTVTPEPVTVYPKLRLYFSVKPWYVNQKFGETANLQYYKDNGLTIIGHNGIDAQANHGQPIYASHDGICYPEIDDKAGNGVVIMTKEMFDFDGKPVYFKTIYWHLIQDDAVVKTGQIVRAGDLIGYADSTGLSTGDHLHFGLKPVLPNEAAGTWYNVFQTNGYFGAIDPQPYFNGLFAQDINVNLSKQPLKHTFYIHMKRGDANSEVLWLQRCLASIGFFPENVIPNGIYGPVTQRAVFDFQKKYATYSLSAFMNVWINMGTNAGALTLAALNKIFS